MPLENATIIKDFNPSYPLGTDPVASADDHIRLIKQVLKNTFPNIDAPVTLSSASLNGTGVPSKGIIMFSGLASAIPAGWFLCDGTNGTPDLRNRFIVGAGSSYPAGSTGGSTSGTTGTAGNHTHAIASDGAHTHVGTVAGHTLTVDEIPSHNHVSGWGESDAQTSPYGTDGSMSNHAGSGRSDNDNYAWNTSSTGGSKAHDHGLSMDTAGLHTHNANPGGDHSHSVSITPPFYALCFIMKG